GDVGHRLGARNRGRTELEAGVDPLRAHGRAHREARGPHVHLGVDLLAEDRLVVRVHADLHGVGALARDAGVGGDVDVRTQPERAGADGWIALVPGPVL